MTPFAAANLKPVLEGKRVLLGISGSIAAFKACDVVRFLRACGAEVRVVLTESAARFVTPTTLETLSGNRVLSSMWEDGIQGTHHIEAARWAHVAAVAPASANTIGRLALGLADDLLSTELLAFRGPVVVAPAMNPAMFSHPAVALNLDTLRRRGAAVVGPAVGATACGEEGLGRMSDPEDIVEAVARCLYAPANNRRVLVTLGPTQSALDPVRYLTNRSSGKMGAALCWAAAERGYEVTAVCGPVAREIRLPAGAEVVRVATADEMAAAVSANWPACSVFVAAAAVLDWDVANPSGRKLKKTREAPRVEMKRTVDILAAVCRARRPGQFVLGFAAETDAHLENARAKLQAKGCDALFVNDVSRKSTGFESDSNAGWWLQRGRRATLKFGPQPKARLARELFSLIEDGGRAAHGPLRRPARPFVAGTADAIVN